MASISCTVSVSNVVFIHVVIFLMEYHNSTGLCKKYIYYYVQCYA